MQTSLAIFIAIASVLITSLAGQYFTNRSVNSSWYACIKPGLTPPPIVFPIVWTALYILIAIAFARLLIADNRIAIVLLASNLVLNVFWCYLFFDAKNPLLAIPVILIIWATILMVQWTHRFDRITVFLLLPYLLWITFATILNIQAARNSGEKCSK